MSWPLALSEPNSSANSFWFASIASLGSIANDSSVSFIVGSPSPGILTSFVSGKGSLGSPIISSSPSNTLPSPFIISPVVVDLILPSWSWYVLSLLKMSIRSLFGLGV